MRRLLEGPLISEEEMGRRDAEFRRRARVTLAEIGSRWPQLSGDFQKELENNMQARYEIYRKERLARQSRAESQLRNALEAAVERYDAQTNRSLVAASIGERESGATDADFRREALGTFSNIAACYPNISKKFEDELKTVVFRSSRFLRSAGNFLRFRLVISNAHECHENDK
ncbi:unnamed protein product [Darwinula stevensoni]|uniref:Uncharacterized protein n=1 Tax=Darwinula stevensoni TaxID=69355 RepID=A0A7R9AK60_9CRUS|nr:unnamed protein product [Darwinula stevensoni]CAG0909231.1 unnamed protein product [Darwinula stevensoni]